jgi:arylsulfatase A-like enzyme
MKDAFGKACLKAVARCSLIVFLGITPLRVEGAGKPNVLFIAMDDLNDWIGCMGGHPQTITPNLDRLAKSGVLFSNAHCAAPACNPSRSAIMTGISPHRSGLYENGQKMRDVMPDAVLMPKWFSRNGYWSAGSGKLLHYFIDADSWDEYHPDKAGENPFPRTLYPEKRPMSLPRGGPWQYVETDWGALDASDEEFGGDWLVSKWIGEQLAAKHDKPFFLACGIYRPHEPWFVPKKYFEPFPLKDIQLPPGYKEGDLDDLPEEGRRRGPNRYFAHILEQNQWRQGVQGYLASIHFADAMLGRVMDALESGPNRDQTIVVLWSDHGWHLGEKQHWQKYTAWRACTRVPLMIRVPKGIAPGLPDGTRAGEACSAPVNLLSLFPTLTELAGIRSDPGHDGPSLVPLLKDSEHDWRHVSLTHLGDAGSFGMSDRKWRYIRYAKGGEELYDIEKDPYEWTNLAADPKHYDRLLALRNRAPVDFAPKAKTRVESLPGLEWRPVKDGAVPPSVPDGNAFDVVFVNKAGRGLELFWQDRTGGAKSYGQIPAGESRSMRTRPGAVWSLREPASETVSGYFVIGDRPAKAIIPKR